MKSPANAESLKAVSGALCQTREYLDCLGLIPRRSLPDVVLLALLSKSIVLAEAIVSLVSNSFADEAFGLCRTNLEVQLTIRYLTNRDTEKRSSRYFLYFAKDKTEWARLINKYYPNLRLKTRSDADEIETLAAAYKNPHKWSECPNSLRDFASEPDSLETREDGSPLEELFYYEVLYKWMSHYVHATVSGIDPSHTTASGETFKVHRGRGTMDHGEGALRTAFLSVHLNLLRVFRYFNMDVPEHLKSKYDEVVAAHFK